MLHFFRINDPYRLFGLLVLLLLIQIPLLIDSPEITYPELKGLLVGEKIHEDGVPYLDLVDSTAPLAAWFDGLMDMFFGRSVLARRMLAFVIVFLQASFIGIMLADKKAFAENTYIPALIFAILSSFSFDMLSLTPELIGSGFLLPALNNLFKEIEFREQRNESIFNLGLYISLASLFAFSYTVFLFGTFITLIIFTRSTPRKYLLLVFGFLLPHILLISCYYLMDGLSPLWQFFYMPNLSIRSDHYMSSASLLWLGALPAFFLITSFVTMTREARLSKYQTQLVQTMFLWMLFSFLHVLYSKDLRPQNLITLIPSLSFFITHFLLLIRRKRFSEMYIWILLIGTISIGYAARYNRLARIDYQRLIVPDQKSIDNVKRILMLDDDWSIYKYHRLATPFLNWGLAEEIFSHPEYYENTLQVYDGFQADPPDIIRDRNDLLKPFLSRIPELKEQLLSGWRLLLQKVCQQLILSTRVACLPPSNDASRKFSRILSASSILMKRAGRHTIFASL